MIHSISIRSTHGCPSMVELNGTVVTVAAYSKVNSLHEVYLGNPEITDRLPVGYSVNISALTKSPWICFGKVFYLLVNNVLIESKNEEIFNQQVGGGKAIVCHGLRLDGEWFLYIVVEQSADTRFKWYPKIVAYTQ